MTIKISRFRMDMGNLPIRAASTVGFQGSSSGNAATVQAPAAVSTITLTLPGITDTLRGLQSRVTSTASNATPTPNADTDDQYNITGLTAGATFGAPTGTPTAGQTLIIRIKDNGVSIRSLAWNAVYRASSDLALPTTTILGKTLYLGFRYNSTDSKWDLLALLNNF